MSPEQYIVQCLRPNCSFRYLSPTKDIKQSACIKCGAPTRITPFFVENLPGRKKTIENPRHIEIICDNIRSANNLGSIFRTADGAGVSHIFVCGITTAPDHPAVQKTALGAEKFIPWTQSWNAFDTAISLKNSNYMMVALENSRRSQSLFDLHHMPHGPLALVIGNEINGIDPKILDLCDLHLNIPMLGQKNSLNVAVAFGIAVYTLMFLPI